MSCHGRLAGWRAASRLALHSRSRVNFSALVSALDSASSLRPSACLYTYTYTSAYTYNSLRLVSSPCPLMRIHPLPRNR